MRMRKIIGVSLGTATVSSDDGQQHQWEVVLGTFGTMQQEPHPDS